MTGAAPDRIRVGKRLRDMLYVHRSAEAYLRGPDAELLARACAMLPEAGWNVARITRSGEVGLMLYEDFSVSAFPALLRSAVVDLRTGATRFRDWGSVTSPPIIHRKELMLPPDFPGLDEFAALTADLEGRGVFGEPTKIGTRRAWTEILAAAGIRVEGHAVVLLDAAPGMDDVHPEPDEEPGVPGFGR